MHPILHPLFHFDTLNLPAAIGWPMFPYDRRLQWILKGPYRHLYDGLRKDGHLLEGPFQPQIAARIKAMQLWVLIRTILLVPLSVSIITSIVSVVRDYLGGFQAAEVAFSAFAKLSTTFATVFALLFLFASRTLDQLRSDLTVLMARNMLANMERGDAE